MCCRYWIGQSSWLDPIVELMNRSPLAEVFAQRGNVVSRGEVRPTDVAPVIATARSGGRAVFPMRWGFRGKSLLINARVETAAERPAFREAWAGHRCVVPASYYFEWEHLTGEDGKKKTGDRFQLCPRGDEVTWLAGLYRIEDGLPCFVVLTREPGDGIRFIHDRMPLMLPESSVDEWIRPGADPEKVVRTAMTDIAFERAG